MHRLRFAAVLAALILEALCGTAAFAQSAKLTGRVTDAANRETLPGASVLLVGTALGATANGDGVYTVIGIVPGVYTVRFSYIGYTSRDVEIRLVSDRTTDLDQALRATDAEGSEVVVETSRPIVDQNQTTSRAIVTGEEMSRLPITSLQDAISRTANAYDGFVRGSRRYETRTVLEGIDVSDALTQIAPNGQGTAYAGLIYDNTNRSSQTNTSLFTINPEGVEEVTVNTGATEARNGAASGGVVAITLAEGRGPLRGSFSYRSAPTIRQPGPDSLQFYGLDGDRYLAERQTLVTAGTPTSMTRAANYVWEPGKYQMNAEPETDARLTLGGSPWRAVSFFGTGQFFRTNGYQPNTFQKRLSGQLKSTITPFKGTRLTLLGIAEDRGLWGNWNNTAYNDYWRFYLEGVAQNDGGSTLGSAKITQVLSDRVYVEAQLYQTYQRSRYGYVDDDGDGFSQTGENGKFLDFTDPAVADKYIGRAADNTKMFNENATNTEFNTTLATTAGTFYKVGRPTPYSEDARQRTRGWRVDVGAQATDNHFIQAGLSSRLRRFDYQQVAGVDGSAAKINNTIEPFQLQEWTRKPTEFSLYGSDRMEFGGLVINAGLRIDVVNRDMEKINDLFRPFRRDTVVIGAGTALQRRAPRNVFDRGEEVALDAFYNPSIGVSHPIGTKGSMYFSYARAQQLLPYTTLYQFYDGNNSNNQFYTYQDPEQKPITSNNYEIGVQWEFLRGWGLDVNAYTRSIDNYGQAVLTANNRNRVGQNTIGSLPTYAYATTAGYADVRGIEVVLRRATLRLRRGVALGLTTSYTFSSIEIANYAGSNVTNFTNTGGGTTVGGNAVPLVRTLPFDNVDEFKNFPQNVRGGNSTLTAGYDRTHRVVVRGIATLPYLVQIGLNGSLESGFLFPPVLGVDPRDRALLTAPTNARLDARVEKKFNVNRRFGLDVYLDVTNVFDRANIVAYESFTPYGQALFQETQNPGTRLVLKDGTATYGPSRTVYFGTRVRF